MEKGLYAAPMGIEEELMANGPTPDIEIEVEDPEAVNIGLGDIEIQLRAEREGEIGRAHV